MISYQLIAENSCNYALEKEKKIKRNWELTIYLAINTEQEVFSKH